MRHPEKIRRKGRAGKSYDVWQVRFTDAHGLIRYRSFRTKSDAQGFSAEAETAKRGGASASADVRFDTLCTEYRESHLPSLRESSREQVEADLARLESHFGRRTLRSLTPATIEDFRRDELLRIRDRQSALHARRVARTERAIAALKADESEQRERLQATLAYLSERGARVPMSGIRTVNKALGALRTLLKFAQSRGYVLGNSASHVRKIKSPPHIDRPMDQQILTPSELQRLIAGADPSWRAAIGVLAYGGLRIGELLALQWGDVELDAARVLVQRQVDTGTGEIRDPKTKAGRRFVELPAFVVRDLRIWKAACPPQAEGQADWCFPNAVGGPMDQYNFRSRVFLPALRRAKLRRVRIHDLRHGCASMLVASGADIAAISRHLGHANVAITLGVYSHWFARRQDSGLGARLGAFVEKEIGCVLVATDAGEASDTSHVLELMVGRGRFGLFLRS